MGKHVNHYNIGDSKMMNCGMVATIIAKRCYKDIDIQFENGEIATNINTSKFSVGSVKCPNYKTKSKIKTISRLGECRLMNCGMMAKIISYRYCDDIDVEFDDGFVAKNKSYRKFSIGSIHNKNCDRISNKKSERIGLEKENNGGSIMKIVEYIDYDNILIEFQDENKTIIKTTYGHFKKGDITNPFLKTKFNVGCIGGTSTMDNDGNFKKSYKHWSNMLRRCYFDNSNCYRDVYVCSEWLTYENFEKWYNDNYKENKDISFCLDKDILSYSKGINKIYSPNNCSFVPSEINTSFKPNSMDIFYNEKHKKYTSKIGRKHIGTFNTYEEARIEYMKRKKEKYKMLANKYKDFITEEVFNILYNYKGEEL